MKFSELSLNRACSCPKYVSVSCSFGRPPWEPSVKIDIRKVTDFVGAVTGGAGGDQMWRRVLSSYLGLAEALALVWQWRERAGRGARPRCSAGERPLCPPTLLLACHPTQLTPEHPLITQRLCQNGRHLASHHQQHLTRWVWRSSGGGCSQGDADAPIWSLIIRCLLLAWRENIDHHLCLVRSHLLYDLIWILYSVDFKILFSVSNDSRSQLVRECSIFRSVCCTLHVICVNQLMFTWPIY